MAIKTSWVLPPHTIGGLDHIGTQGPCILIYSQLLPGITNVTDRARYYSFYPWLIRSYAERDSHRENFNAFLEAYRKADCLFTMIAERHAQVMGDDAARHGPAMVGRDTLNDAVRLIGEGKSVRLSTYATREDSDKRYFANKLGGLGQYYAGTLTQLDILAVVDKPWLSYTHERGGPIAQAFDMGVDGRSFWQAVDADTVSARTLDALQDFCPCCLPNRQGERDALLDILFDRKSEFEAEGVQRRKSLALLLHLAGALQAVELSAVDEPTFRAAVYTETLADGTTWCPPASLAHTRSAWAYYVRNDLMSIAMQKAFAISLTLGITCGYLISRSPYLVKVFEPLFAGIYSIPIILFLPLYVLFFGLGSPSKIALGATISFFPIVLNTIVGFGYVDRTLVTAARSMGASDLQLFRYVLFPAALPVILAAVAVLLLVVAVLTIVALDVISRRVARRG